MNFNSKAARTRRNDVLLIAGFLVSAATVFLASPLRGWAAVCFHRSPYGSLLTLICLSEAAVIALLANPLRRFVDLYAQRSPYCSIIDSLKAYGVRFEQLRIRNRIRGAIRRLQKDPSGIELWETPKGRFWTSDGSENLTILLAEQERRVYGGEVRNGDIVLDCGANIGVYTREALRMGAKLVVAIEPVPETAECLRRNVAEEISAGRVVIYQKGVWNRDEQMRFWGRGVGASVCWKTDNPEESRVLSLTTIDQIVSELQLEMVDVIKMDVEGAEAQALSGANGTLAKYKPSLAIAGYHRIADAESIPSVVSQAFAGYEMRIGSYYSPGGLRPEVLFFHAAVRPEVGSERVFAS
jgi:FkbM family methyltransferase